MGRGSALSKLNRLDQLLARLKSAEVLTAGALADEFAVSLRTLMRDIQTLREKGYPIEADRGRGGGVRLYSKWGIGRLSLNYREVIDLLLALKVLEKLKSPLFLNNLESVTKKLYASFPDAQRPQIQKIRNRIFITQLSSIQLMDNKNNNDINSSQNDIILKSFFDQSCVEIHYKKKDNSSSKRLIEIHYLLLSWPIWYLICFDHKTGGHRTFRIDRITLAKNTDQLFNIRKLADFSPEFEQFSSRL